MLRQALAEVRIRHGEWGRADAATLEVQLGSSTSREGISYLHLQRNYTKPPQSLLTKTFYAN
jgi:hypothetical protein